MVTSTTKFYTYFRHRCCESPWFNSRTMQSEHQDYFLPSTVSSTHNTNVKLHLVWTKGQMLPQRQSWVAAPSRRCSQLEKGHRTFFSGIRFTFSGIIRDVYIPTNASEEPLDSKIIHYAVSNK